MKKIIRHYVYDTFALFTASKIATGIVYEKDVETILLAGLGITVAMLLVKPIINILLLPINLITFGLFRFVSSAIALYLVTLVVPGFKILGFYFGGFSSKWLDVPELDFSGVLSFVGFSFIISFIISFVFWIRK